MLFWFLVCSSYFVVLSSVFFCYLFLLFVNNSFAIFGIFSHFLFFVIYCSLLLICFNLYSLVFILIFLLIEFFVLFNTLFLVCWFLIVIWLPFVVCCICFFYNLLFFICGSLFVICHLLSVISYSLFVIFCYVYINQIQVYFYIDFICIDRDFGVTANLSWGCIWYVVFHYLGSLGLGFYLYFFLLLHICYLVFIFNISLFWLFVFLGGGVVCLFLFGHLLCCLLLIFLL